MRRVGGLYRRDPELEKRLGLVLGPGLEFEDGIRLGPWLELGFRLAGLVGFTTAIGSVMLSLVVMKVSFCSSV